MNNNLNLSLLLYLILFLFFFNSKKSTFQNQNHKKNHYQYLLDNYNIIIPNGNRNSAGALFFKYIINLNLTYNDFLEYNKLYCAVSGSLVNPNSKPDFIKLNELNTQKLICGNYYRCCIPCNCDIMKYAKAKIIKHKFIDKEHEICLIIIKNP
jgi:hypothetical protein